jgi:hypothetical protein
VAIAGQASAADDPDCKKPNAAPDCGVHNMMLVGTKKAYLSHLPMFHSEHRFQVILEARFDNGSKTVDRIYFDDRAKHPSIGMFTVSPGELFKLSRLFAPADQPERNGFSATVFRGHLERGGVEIDGLAGINVTVTRIIYAQELKPGAKRADSLRYILFGGAGEFFLAHQITQAPDFDQIVVVDIDGHTFRQEELEAGVIVTIPDRNNTAEDRLRAGDVVAATAVVGNGVDKIDVTVTFAAEPYFEESELRANPDFGSSKIEKAAGF